MTSVVRSQAKYKHYSAQMQEGLAHLCLVGSATTLTRAKIEANLPRKRGPAVAGYDKAYTKFQEKWVGDMLAYIKYQGVWVGMQLLPGEGCPRC
eukprot:655116-Pelagomonas_calceolata.AAC.1